MWRFGTTYCAAAITLSNSDPDKLFIPALQLSGQSIELLLKAFLLKRGATLADLKKRSHGLTGLLVEAKRRRLGLLVRVPRTEQQTIQLLDETYSSQRLRYIVSGSVRFPQLCDAISAARRLSNGLVEYCTGEERVVLPENG